MSEWIVHDGGFENMLYADVRWMEVGCCTGVERNKHHEILLLSWKSRRMRQHRDYDTAASVSQVCQNTKQPRGYRGCFEVSSRDYIAVLDEPRPMNQPTIAAGMTQ